MLDRNFALIQVHRAGTWWMDLMAAGAFNHPDLGPLLKRRVQGYQETLRRPEPYRAQVALVVDERSKLTVRSDWDANAWALGALRTAIGKAGVPVAWVSLEDVIQGVAPPCRVYVFANAFWLDAARRDALLERLRRERAAAVWVYAPGYLGPGGADAAQVGNVTGVAVEVIPGKQGSTGCGLLAGEAWGLEAEVEPRLVVRDDRAEPLGHYRSDGLVSAARGRAAGHESYFLADLAPTAPVLRRLLAAAGAHIWADGGEVVQTDGRVLAVHAAEPGEHRLHLPPGVTALPLEADVARTEGDAVILRFPRDATQWLELKPRG